MTKYYPRERLNMRSCRSKTIHVAGYGEAAFFLLRLCLLGVAGCGGQDRSTAENPTGPNERAAESAPADGSNTAAPTDPASADAAGPDSPEAAGAKSVPGMPTVQEPTAESLKAVVASWQKARFADDPDTRVAAGEAMLPRAEDIPVIFPGLSEQQMGLATRAIVAFRGWAGARARNMELRHLLDGRQANQAAAAKLGEAASVRDMDLSERKQQLIDRSPADLPIYHIDLPFHWYRSEMFYFANGRWVWMGEFEEMIGMVLEGKLTEQAVSGFERHAQKELQRRPQSAGQPAGHEDLGDLHYGLVVYLGALDQHLRLGPRARFVRAAYRREGQSYPIDRSAKASDAKDPLGALVGRVRRFGKNLRHCMSDQERKRLDALVKEGYFYGVEAARGNLAWRSNKGLEGAVAMRRVSSGPGSSRTRISRPPQPQPEELVLQPSDAAALLETRDRALCTAVIGQLAVLPLDSQCRPAICAALLRQLQDRQSHRYAHPRYTLLCYLRWVSWDDCDSLEELLSERHVGRHLLVTAFVRLVELDRERAFQYVRLRAPYETIMDWRTPDVFDAAWRGDKPVWNTGFVKVGPDGRFVRDGSTAGQSAVDARSVAIFKQFVRALLESGEKDRLMLAVNAIEGPHPGDVKTTVAELMEEAIPYLSKHPDSYLKRQATRFANQVRATGDRGAAAPK